MGCGCGYHDLLMALRSERPRVYDIDYFAKVIDTAEPEYPHAKVRRQVADIQVFGCNVGMQLAAFAGNGRSHSPMGTLLPMGLRLAAARHWAGSAHGAGAIFQVVARPNAK